MSPEHTITNTVILFILDSQKTEQCLPLLIRVFILASPWISGNCIKEEDTYPPTSKNQEPENEVKWNGNEIGITANVVNCKLYICNMVGYYFYQTSFLISTHLATFHLLLVSYYLPGSQQSFESI